MFWTDAVQAQERLSGCAVCYDKKPVYIDQIGTKNVSYVDLVDGAYKTTTLDDEKWFNFRDLPKLGWFNYVGGNKIVPIYMERRSINSRSHGLNTNNVKTWTLTADGLSTERYSNFTEYMKNVGYHETMADEAAYPKLSEILMSLDESPGGVAFSSKFCVVVTSEGMKWLFRRDRRIGFFTGADSLNLFPRNAYYKEELQACPSFDINNIREF